MSLLFCRKLKEKVQLQKEGRVSPKSRLGALKKKERPGEAETQRPRIRSKPNQLHGLAGQREGGGGAWAPRKFMEKVELSEEPGGGWGGQEGQTRISQLLLRWPGESGKRS